MTGRRAVLLPVSGSVTDSGCRRGTWGERSVFGEAAGDGGARTRLGPGYGRKSPLRGGGSGVRGQQCSQRSEDRADRGLPKGENRSTQAGSTEHGISRSMIDVQNIGSCRARPTLHPTASAPKGAPPLCGRGQRVRCAAGARPVAPGDQITPHPVHPLNR